MTEHTTPLPVLMTSDADNIRIVFMHLDQNQIEHVFFEERDAIRPYIEIKQDLQSGIETTELSADSPLIHPPGRHWLAAGHGERIKRDKDRKRHEHFNIFMRRVGGLSPFGEQYDDCSMPE